MSTPFLQQPLLTCIGNKRKLIEPIIAVVREVAARLGKERLVIVDACTGSGVVARHLLSLADTLYINDLEHYAYIMARSVFEKPSVEQQAELQHHFATMNLLAEQGSYIEGIVSQHYAPRETANVKEGERCFYTRENALRIDTLRSYIDREVPTSLQHWCMAPLLVKASIHTNTSGVFKGHHRYNGIGCFGGKGGDALGRIMKPIEIKIPQWSESSAEVHCSQLDVLTLIDTLPGGVDVIYLDPPYTSAPYSSNYFMLNVIASNKMPAKVSRVSGIPADWNRSTFNYHASAVETMRTLLSKAVGKVKYLLISYNNEGLITPSEWQELLAPYEVETREIEYDTYKGSRNLAARNAKVTELLYLVKVNTPTHLQLTRDKE